MLVHIRFAQPIGNEADHSDISRDGDEEVACLHPGSPSFRPGGWLDVLDFFQVEINRLV
ncbi:MAG TPA: hypothetical protein VJ739_16060 [Gemmataceae bacterium]|nr:hypothetical protein [Gemmataceae bacterium]